MKAIFQSITDILSTIAALNLKRIKFKYKPKVNALKNRYASHFYLIYKETFKILTKIFHTFNFHLQM